MPLILNSLILGADTRLIRKKYMTPPHTHTYIARPFRFSRKRVKCNVMEFKMYIGFFVKSGHYMAREKDTSGDFFLLLQARKKTHTTNQSTVSAVERFVCASRKEVEFIRRGKQHAWRRWRMRRVKRLAFLLGFFKMRKSGFALLARMISATRKVLDFVFF